MRRSDTPAGRTTSSGQHSQAVLAVAEPGSWVDAIQKPTDPRCAPATQPPPAGQCTTHSRKDAISGNWTLFSSSRNDRPNDFTTQTSGPASAENCPFCLGNEAQTPPAVLAIDDRSAAPYANTASGQDCGCRWSIRVIPNKFPAVAPLPLDQPSGGADQLVEGAEEPLFCSRPSYGGHEVFIESPCHNGTLHQLDLAQVTSLLRVYQERIRHWAQQPAIQYVSLFKNVGPAAGASLHHPHSQLIALDRLPQAVRLTSDRMRRHHAKTGCCLQCEVLRAELKAKVRVVAVTDSLVAYCPFASQLPMLLRVTTRRHVDRFEDLGDRELDELARLMRRSIGWLQTLYPDVAYNYLFHTKPARQSPLECFHWSFELFPRLTSLAGFEWSCGTLINPVMPETAATHFRTLAQQENPMR